MSNGPHRRVPSSRSTFTPTLTEVPAAHDVRRSHRARLFGVALAALALVAVPIAALAVTVEQRVLTSANDAEESATGVVSLTSSNLQLVFDTSNQTVGMRWGLAIPKGATVTAAYIQFYANQAQSEVTNLTFRAQAADNPGAFTTANGNISGRPLTVNATSWSPPAWITNEVGPNERTPDLTAVLNEVVSRPGWASGNAVAIIVTGTGHRTAWSWDGRHNRAPLLHVEYTPPDFPPVARMSVTQLAIPALTVNANAAASTDTDATPIASYHFDFGDGTPIVNTIAPTATAQHTYAAAGPYTVTLTVTDTGSLTSAPVTSAVTVQPDLPPVATLAVTQLASPAFTVSASAAGSTDTDLTPIATYHFDFGDGTPVVNTTAPTLTAPHTYAGVGTYTVTLTATDTGNNTSAPVTASVTVTPPQDFPPVASLSVTQLASPPLTVNANASGSTDADLTPIATYHFDFGDTTPVVNTTAPTATAQHTYATAGSHTVTVTVTDTGNNTSTPASVTLTVQPESPPVASLAVTQLASPPLTVNANASGSTDADLTPIASYHFDFGDGTPVVNTTAPTASAQHTYAAAGSYTVSVTATDTGNNTSAPATATLNVTSSQTPTIVEKRVIASTDDAEEFADGTMYLNSSDLELIHDASDQTVGMRWTALAIPPGVTITNAYIQFASKDSQSVATTITFRGQAADNPPTFGASAFDVTSRPRTTAAMTWSPVPWNTGEAGPNQRTPDMSAVIQEVVSRPGWASGNALIVIVNGTGHRTAWAWDGMPTLAPLLHVEYVGGTPPDLAPVASVSVTQLASPALTVSADGSGSTDTDATPIATYHFDFGDGSPVVNASAPTATVQHTYAAAGTYTITLTATDTGNNTSAPASASKTVTSSSGPQVAVYVGYYDTHHAVNTQPKPDPWRGSPNTIFIGTQDNQKGDPPTGGWDSSCLRIDNLTSGTLSGVVVTADIGTHHYALWGTNSIPAGQHLVLAQTAFENFDGSDTNPAGCYGCDPAQCLTLKTSIVPVVHVTVGGGATANYPDPGQYLNTHGADAAGCPYVGGPLPQTRYDESENWVQVYPNGSAPAQGAGEPAAGAAVSDWGRVLALSPPAPNPARGELTMRFAVPEHGPVHVALFDLQGRLVRPFINNILDAATYSFQVHLDGVEPGIYFVRLWTPQGARGQKVILMQ